MKPYSSNIGDTLLGMIFFIEAALAHWGLWESCNTSVKTCRVYLVL